MKTSGLFKIAAAALAAIFLTSGVQASTIAPGAYSSVAQCDGDPTTFHEFYLGSDDATVSCYYTGTTANPNSDPTYQALVSNYTLFDKSDDATSGILDDIMQFNGMNTGTFTMDLNGYVTMYLLFKVGNNLTNGWAIFEITNFVQGLNTFAFAIDPAQGGGLSFAAAIGAVPLPAPALLLLGAIGGLGLVSRRRTKHNAA